MSNWNVISGSLLDADNLLKLKDIAVSASPWVILIVVVFLLIFYTEKLEHFLATGLKLFSFLGGRVNKIRISKEIRANVIKATKAASKEFEELLPQDIKIQWLTESSRESFIKSNKVVVCLSNDEQENSVIVSAVYEYIKCALLEEERIVLDEEIYTSSSIAMTSKFLKKGYKSGISTFFDKVVKKETARNDKLEELTTKLIEIDAAGFFTNIYLPEVKSKSALQQGRLRNLQFNKETYEFIDFLYEIAIREPGSFNQLNFIKKYYKVGIILVAKFMTFTIQGTRPYIKWYDQYVLDGIDGIYLFAKESRTHAISSVIDEIKNKQSYMSHKHSRFEGSTTDGEKYVAECYKIVADRDLVKTEKSA